MTGQADWRDTDRRLGRAEAQHDFEPFFRAIYPKAVAVAERVTGELAAAEDAAIEALAKAHFRWARIGEQPWRDAWVIRVTINQAITRLPRPPRTPRVTDGPDHADGVVLRNTLQMAVRQLPRRQREVVCLRYLVGLSENEIAAALDLGLGTVKTHLRRGIASLRASVGRHLKEEHVAQLT
jgi:RNA polymerase sigma factor (sigma-70 family)